MERTINGPFGKASLVLSLGTDDVVAAYRMKCGADVSRWFHDLTEIHLFECQETGYRFWRPASIAGDEQFYKYLSGLWPDYYRSERWEYPLVREELAKSDRLIEIGCGRGFFLNSIEGRVADAIGVEFNAGAIARKATTFDIVNSSIERIAERNPQGFSVACSFQVLEHVIDPCSFLMACLKCLRPGGLLAVATPNHESAMLANREDAFDLPPHHMGHFSAHVYERVAQLCGLKLEKVHVERKYFLPKDTVTEATRSSFVYRAARRLSFTSMHLAYSISREPGNNILAIMRKC